MVSTFLHQELIPVLLRYSSTVATNKPKPTVGERPANGICSVPYGPDVTVVLTDGNDNWLNVSLPDPKAPKFSKMEIFCNSRYALANGEKVQQLVCLQKGHWNPPLRPCLSKLFTKKIF